MRQGSRGSYRVSSEESGLILFRSMELGFPLELQKGFQTSCQVDVGNLGFFGGEEGITPHFMLLGDTQGSIRVCAGESGLISS